MTQVKEALFDAFREDHALLGGALYELRAKLAANDMAGAKAVAERIDLESGAHVAFEEEDFYPALKGFMTQSEIDRMYAAHADGLALIRAIMGIEERAAPPAETFRDLIAKVDRLEAHVSECGELFGVMGGLSPQRHRELMTRLEHWRNAAPSWREYSAGAPTPGL